MRNSNTNKNTCYENVILALCNYSSGRENKYVKENKANPANKLTNPVCFRISIHLEVEYALNIQKEGLFVA